MLNLQDDQALFAPQPDTPEAYRNPTTAFLLSLLCPGLGHLYLGLRSNAAWIFGMELLCVAIFFTTGTLHDAAVLSIPAIYCFAMIDAYASARESNAGLSSFMIGANPRIAAILNLLTKGFGYFYLGDRTKGILCFFVILVLQSLLRPHMNIWLAILTISLQVAIAIDAYRAARQTLLLNHPELIEKSEQSQPASSDVIALANPGGMRPAVVTSISCIIGLVFLAGYVTMIALNGHAVSSRGTIEQGPGGLTYRDQKEHFSLTLPEDWTSLPPNGSLALFAGDGASVLIQEQYSSYSPATLLEETKKQMLPHHPDATTESCSYPLAGRTAKCLEIHYKDARNKPITQRIFALPRFFKLFVFIETWNDQPRPPSFDRIEQNLWVK